MTEWQPIETAPRDIRILGFDGCRREVMKYDDYFGEWQRDEGEIIFHPTHWTPIPDPPVSPPEQSK